jgi:phosphatidylglycerol:prolipoprotein diacylglycerol transferase
MIPYFTIPSIHLFGPVYLHPFGVLFMLGIFIAYRVMMSRADHIQIPREELKTALIWAFAAGVVAAHMIEILLYQPELIRTEGLSVFFRVFTGLSSIGGLFGGLLGFCVYLKRRSRPCIPHLSVMVEGFVIWWAFVRLGCTLAHDHLGRFTSFFMAFNYPSGARHNLGFYEFLMVILVLFPLTIIFRRSQARPSDYVGTMFLVYGSLRFGLDFLRATDLPGSDLRYWGLTAAQYGCVVLTFIGLFMLLLRSPVPKQTGAWAVGPRKRPPHDGAAIA